MAWIKRNLIFVVGLLIAVLLVGGGVFYLLKSKSEADDVATQLEAANQQYEQLLGRDPFPNTENIKATRAEQDRVREFEGSCRRFFAAPGLSDRLDDESFKALLESTIYNLDREADRRGVKLPAGVSTGTGTGRYGFTFSQQKNQLKFPPGSHKAFAVQLLDLESICGILFESRIHSIVELRRTAVGTNDAPSSAEVIAGKKVGTNSVVGASLYPYQIAFQCFSGELASVLNNFARASNTFLLKTINVERGQLESTAQPVVVQPNFQAPFRGDPGLAARYGLNRPQMVAPPPTAPAGGRPGEVVLDEKPLKVTIGLEVVRLAGPAPAAGMTPKPKAGARSVQ